jgi:hypothetical protein
MFLGFVHICSKTREGWFLLKRQTDGKRAREAEAAEERASADAACVGP